MEYILFSLVGVLGVWLTYCVVREHDWDTPAHSLIRNVEFLYGAIGALAWSYCLMGMPQASLSISIFIGVLNCIALYNFYRYGVRATARCIQKRITQIRDMIKTDSK